MWILWCIHCIYNSTVACDFFTRYVFYLKKRRALFVPRTTTILSNANFKFSFPSLLGGPDNLGYICLAALYGTFCVACFFVPPWIEYIGPKWAMVLGACPYVLMVGATLAPSYYLSIPMNIAVGLGAPLLWTGSSVYIGRCAVKQAKVNERCDVQNSPTHELPSFEKRVGDLTAKMNSVFFMMFQGNGTIGLCMSSIVLHLAGDNGVRYLFILLVAICIFGVFILSTLPKIPAVVKDEVSTSSWTDTIRLAFTDPKITLLVPLFLYNGLSLGFLFGDFTNDVVHKAVGLNNTGFVMGAFFFVNAGVTYASGSKILGVSRFGRLNYMIMSVAVQVLYFVWLLLWNSPVNSVKQCSFNDCNAPDLGGCDLNQCVEPYGKGSNFTHDDSYELLVETPSLNCWLHLMGLSAAFAMGDAIWESFPPGIIQVFYKDDDDKLKSASANYKLWQSMGFAIQFVLGVVLSDYFHAKIWILLVCLGLCSVSLIVLHTRVSNLNSISDNDSREDDRYKTLIDDDDDDDEES